MPPGPSVRALPARDGIAALRRLLTTPRRRSCTSPTNGAAMRIPRFRQRHERRGEEEPASEAADDPASGAGSSSSETVGGVRLPPAAPASSDGITAIAFAVECYADAWREAATDAELAFGWWVTASVRDR